MSFVREPGCEPLPGYKLIEPLGSGGYGEVWKCEAPGGLLKAIKFVYGNLNSLDAEGVRAEQERHALNHIKEVRHPFVLSNERIEIVEGELVIVMELADKSLYDAFHECQEAGLTGIPRDSLLRYIRDAAEALDHMIEKHNLLHLDIKPRNLFLISDRVKVADFGLVKHLERTSVSGMLSGVTPLYAPPETINNKISPFSDQYSLAIVYQELLTGQRPFSGKNARQLAMQHLHEEPELRSLPEPERPVVARALAKEPEKRWPNCLAFVRALYTAQSSALLTSKTAAPPTGERPKTMADTMEDVLLEQEADEELVHELPQKPAGDEEAEVSHLSHLGLTVAQPQTGVLRPTLVIGLGDFGRQSLLELRCRILDRFGDLAKIPLIHLLYVDCDAEAIRLATHGAPEVALSANAVCHVPLQPASNYRRRSLDHISEWLPREKLHAIPRSLQTQGSRALARLAFADNHLRLLTRLKREIQRITHPDALYQSVSQTGLALRDNLPRIYVIAAAGGGSGGMLADLGYALKNLLKQLRHADAGAIALLMSGAPSDPATPPFEQANIYACLTELNHFDDPAVSFSTQYGPEAPHLRDEGEPLASAYLLQLPHRTPEALRDAVAHVGSYVFHDLTTALGTRLDKGRHAPRPEGFTPFRSFGTFAVWFPRGLLLRLAARQTCARLLNDWKAIEEPDSTTSIASACAEAVNDPQLRFEAILSRVEEIARLPSEGKVSEALTAFLWQMEEQSHQPAAMEDAGPWAQQAVTRLQEWIGSGFTTGQDSAWRQSRLGRAISNAVGQVAQEWEERLAKVAIAQMEQQSRRLAAAEVALQNFMEWSLQAAAAARTTLGPQNQRTEQLCDQLNNALEACLAGAGTFSFFGGGVRRQLRTFVDQLAAYARQHLTLVMAHAGIQFYLQLQARLEERVREITFCRQRLHNLSQCLEASEEDAEGLAAGRYGNEAALSETLPSSTENYWDTIRESGTVRIVLPDGQADLARAADKFVAQLTTEHWRSLDQALSDRVLAPLGGLHYLCVSSGDLLRGLAGPLTEQAALTLGELLPTTDVAQVEFSVAAAEGEDIHNRAKAHFAKAAPMVEAKDGARQHAYLLVPASEAGKHLGEQAKQVLGTLQILPVHGQADLMFCREQANLSPEEVQRLFRPFGPAYAKLAAVPNTSPHARFDISDWVPLDP
jgi:serine/threonine protein kinase